MHVMRNKLACAVKRTLRLKVTKIGQLYGTKLEIRETEKKATRNNAGMHTCK